jgi:hypothetical protein
MDDIMEITDLELNDNDFGGSGGFGGGVDLSTVE